MKAAVLKHFKMAERFFARLLRCQKSTLNLRTLFPLSIGAGDSLLSVILNPCPESNVLALARVATSANPRQPPMNHSVTLPADGGGERLRRWVETPPQASRRRSRPGCSTAVASLARHVICSPRLVPRTPRHMQRRSSRSLGCAGAARRLLPLPPVAPLLFATLMPAAAANPSAALQGGLEREAAVGRRRRECDFVGIKGAPSSPRSSSEGELASR